LWAEKKEGVPTYGRGGKPLFDYLRKRETILETLKKKKGEMFFGKGGRSMVYCREEGIVAAVIRLEPPLGGGRAGGAPSLKKRGNGARHPGGKGNTCFQYLRKSIRTMLAGRHHRERAGALPFRRVWSIQKGGR